MERSKTEGYVHGYSEREHERLRDQAGTLASLLHADISFAAGSRVLEAGCGVGAQTWILAQQSPAAKIVSLDRSLDSVRQADDATSARGSGNVSFLAGDVFKPPFPDECFDHVFVCFVLEHLSRPVEALRSLRALLRKGGGITVIEGDHGSAFFHPDSAEARLAIRGLIEAQARLGGDANIGRRLYPLLVESGFSDVRVSPRAVYADASRPEMVEGFTEKTFTAMVEGARAEILALGAIDGDTWERGIAGLRRTTEADGTFSYCFFKAVGIKPR